MSSIFSLPLLVLFVRVLEYVLNPAQLIEVLSQKTINYNRFSVHSEPGRISLELKSAMQYIDMTSAAASDVCKELAR